MIAAFNTRSILAGVLAVVLAVSGCERRSAPQGSTTAPVSNRAETRDSAIATEIPTIYAELGTPAALSSERKAAILRLAEQLRPAARHLWFILVLANHESREDYWAIAYYTPDESGPRLRKGRCLLVASGKVQMRAKVLKMQTETGRPPGRFTWSQDDLGEYVQISVSGRLFDGTTPIPDIADLPLGLPQSRQPREAVRMNDDELVELVDLARAAMGTTEPIHRIEIEGDIYRVWTGWQVGGLFGRGRVLDIRRKDGRYQQVGGIGQWMS